MIKPIGNIRDCINLKANIQILNGENCIKMSDVPLVIMKYDEPDSAHEKAKETHFKFWFKLENTPFKKIEKQLNPSLKELSIWFNEENENKFKNFISRS